MRIEVERISLRNFKGIKALDVDLGTRTEIYGENATGKTTIFDAFLWCLFGKDGLNKADFDIKNLDAQGNPAHNLEHLVEVVLSSPERKVTLKKVYSEKWTKKRGSASKEFTGHTVDHFMDGVPMKEKEYQERIKGIVDENIFRLCTDPRYFNEVLHWTDRRKILMAVCGDVTADEVIAADASLAGLKSILNGHNIDDYKKMIAAKKAEINRELDKIPTRIDEAKRSIVDISVDISLIPGQIEDLQGKKSDLERQLADLKNGGALSTKRIELQNVESKIITARNDFDRDKGILTSPLLKDKADMQGKADEIGRQIAALTRSIKTGSDEIKSIDSTLASLRAKWEEANAQEIKVTDTCPTCGQALPEIRVNEAREKANNAKAEKLSEITKAGKEKASMRDELSANIEKATGDIQALAEEKQHLDEQIADIQGRIDDVNGQAPNLSALEAQKASIQAEIDNIEATAQSGIDDVKEQIRAVKNDMDTLELALSRQRANEAAEKRIEELAKQEKDLSAMYESIEANLFLVENFIRRKVELLEGRINERFSLARFKLFDDQVNGGLQEVCVTTLNGVPYPSINNAGRIQAGMDIIKTLQGHYGIICPVWIDNRESIVDLPEMPGQVISLIVSEQDKALRIETGDTEYKKAGGM